MHEMEEGSKVPYWFGRGHYWHDSDGNRYGSILAGRRGKTRLNRYSDPNIMHMGAATGVEDRSHQRYRNNSNNAKVETSLFEQLKISATKKSLQRHIFSLELRCFA